MVSNASAGSSETFSSPFVVVVVVAVNSLLAERLWGPKDPLPVPS